MYKKILSKVIESIIKERDTTIEKLQTDFLSDSNSGASNHHCTEQLESIKKQNKMLDEILKSLMDLNYSTLYSTDPSQIHSRSITKPADKDTTNETKVGTDICPMCGGTMIIDYGLVLTSNPPVYKRTCEKCGYTDYITSSQLYQDLSTEIKCEPHKVTLSSLYGETNGSSVSRDEFHQIISDIETGKNPTLISDNNGIRNIK